MKPCIRKALYLCGLVSPVWLALGVTIAGSLYPGYSHVDQALSLLGAVDAPTHGVSPLINNYPLGVLLLLFGLGVFATFKVSLPARLTGVLIMLHGLGSLATGYFACDSGCGLAQPSASQHLHNLAGAVMAFSLLLASFMWIFLARRVLQSKGLLWFSLILTLIAAMMLPWMAAAVQMGHGFGLYQRMNYGASLIWVAGFAWVLLRRPVNGA